MTAEFAIVLPAVLVVLVLAVGAILITTQRVVLTSAAADVARLEARGDEGEATARLGALPSGVTVARSKRGSLHCVNLSAHPMGGLLAAVGVSARGCAARIESSSMAKARGQPSDRAQSTNAGQLTSLSYLTNHERKPTQGRS